MSFLMPIVDFESPSTCFLEPDAFTPELLTALGISDAAEAPIYALWGSNAHCTDLLLSAVADEAGNRSLKSFSCRSPAPPYRRSALWVEGVGLLKCVDTIIPSGCRLIDLSPLVSPYTAEASKALALLKAKERSLCKECENLGFAAARLSETALALTAELHYSDKLVQKADRIALSAPIGEGRAIELPVSTVTEAGERLRALPFGKETQIIGLGELYGVADHFLSLLADALTERQADFAVLTNCWSGGRTGIWLPANGVCYLSDPPAERKKMMTVSRYIAPRPPKVKERYRALEGCRSELCRQLTHFTSDLAELSSQIDSFEANALQKSRFGEFRKRLLIELFCKK